MKQFLVVPLLALVSLLAPAGNSSTNSGPSTDLDLAELARHPHDWPHEVCLTEKITLPIVIDGREMGTVALPAKTRVKLVSIVGTQVRVSHMNTVTMIPARSTDLSARVVSARKIAAASSGPGEEPSSAMTENEKAETIQRKKTDAILQSLPYGNVATLLSITVKDKIIDITFIGKKQEGLFLLFVTFGTSVFDQTSLLNDEMVKEFIDKEGSMSITFMAGKKFEYAIPLRARSVKLDGTEMTATFELPDDVKGTDIVTNARLYQQIKGKYVPCSNVVRTTVTLPGKK